MEERVLLTPLVGSHEEGPLSYLLQVDQTSILLDCGWNERFDPTVLEPLRKVFPTVNLILLSFGDLEHMGALPYCIREFGIRDNCAIYSTAPTKALGLRTLFDAYLCRAKVGEFDFFDVDDINDLEERIKEVRFEMNVTIKGLSVNPINISAIGAGRLLGGCMWHIIREPDSILYAVDFNVGKDSLLDGIVRKCEKLNPTLLITDSSNYLMASRESVNRRKDNLCKRVLEALRQGRSKNVILPVDSAGRVLELLFTLNAYWKAQKLSYPIIWVSPVGQGVVDVAKLNVIDYMNAEINAQVSRSRKNPFENLENVRIVQSISQIEAVRGPKVILAASSSMETGPVQELLRTYGTQPGHLFLLTDKTLMPGSLARRLVQRLEQKSSGGSGMLNMRSADIQIALNEQRWVYKTGPELALWKQERRERLQLEARNRRMEMQNQADQADVAMDGMDVDVRGDENMDNGNAVPEDVSANADAKQPDGPDDKLTRPALIRRQSSLNDLEEARTGGGLFSVFARQGDAARTMFSAFEAERTKRWDEYGERINLEDFAVAAAAHAAGGDDLLDEKREKTDRGDESDGNFFSDDDDDDEDEDEEDADEENKEGMEASDDEDERNIQGTQNINNENDDQSDDGAVVQPTVESNRKKKKKKKNYGNPIQDALLPRSRRNALPRECEKSTLRLQLRCSLAYVDMESRANGVDSKSIVNILKPRKVVVIHGSKQATEEMVAGLKQLALQTVIAPLIGEKTDVSSDVGMWRLELDRSLFDASYPLFSAPNAVQFAPSKKRKTGELVGIRYIEGIVDENEDLLTVIRPLAPSEHLPLSRSFEPRFVHANVDRLVIYKRLQDHDEAEDMDDKYKILPRIESGVILCRDSVSISAEDDGGRLCVEGPICETFYKVRKIVYQSYESV